MWSLVQPSDCVVSGHVYSLVIVCCIWSLVQPGDCIVCGHLYSQSHSPSHRTEISPQKTHKGYKAAKIEKKKKTMLFCFKLGKHAGAREKSNVCILDIHNGVV